MGTHPIFESDFDCLTENAVSRLRLQRVVYSGSAPSEALMNKYPGFYKQAYYPLSHEIQCLDDQMNLTPAPGSTVMHNILKGQSDLTISGKERTKLAALREATVANELEKLTDAASNALEVSGDISQEQLEVSKQAMKQ